MGRLSQCEAQKLHEPISLTASSCLKNLPCKLVSFSGAAFQIRLFLTKRSMFGWKPETLFTLGSTESSVEFDTEIGAGPLGHPTAAVRNRQGLAPLPSFFPVTVGVFSNRKLLAYTRC
jgi:hypothetical protein